MAERKVKVAIIEDHAVTRQGLQAALQQESDIEIVGAAATVAEGIQLCQHTTPQVLLLDLHLPDFEGVKPLIQCFAGLVGHIVVFTSEGRRAFVDAALAMPISGYLLKSESSSVIAESIRQVAAGLRPVVSSELTRLETSLTNAEKSLLRLLAQGYKYESIGRLRQTSPTTVKKQCERLLIKLDLGTREELISWAALHGYADADETGEAQ